MASQDQITVCVEAVIEAARWHAADRILFGSGHPATAESAQAGSEALDKLLDAPGVLPAVREFVHGSRRTLTELLTKPVLRLAGHRDVGMNDLKSLASSGLPVTHGTETTTGSVFAVRQRHVQKAYLLAAMYVVLRDAH